ncbi:hypothetical protein K439DRAFT_1642483, partial [Ramaria rubella]
MVGFSSTHVGTQRCFANIAKTPSRHCSSVQLSTRSISGDLDVANGSRGEIVGIALDPREEKTGSSAIVALEYPPTYILVKLQRTRSSRLRSVRLHGLPIPGTNNTLVKTQSAYCATL